MFEKQIQDLQAILKERPRRQHTALKAVKDLLAHVPSPSPNKQKLILKNHQSPGDTVTLTAAVRDLALSHSDKYLVDVRTATDALWEHNPHITHIDDNDPAATVIDMEYPLIHYSNELPYHFIHAFRMYLENELSIKIPAGEFRGDIHLSRAEKTAPSQVEEITGKDQPYWIMIAGGKTDFTCKLWDFDRYQAVADHLKSKGILCVQVGALDDNHIHRPIKGALNLIGKTDIRQLIRLVHHSSGVICPVTFLMHLAAAVPTRPDRCKGKRPCIVIAGGREPAHWEQYPGHQYLHTIGMLDCCAEGGCWKSRVHPIGDGDEKDKKDLCERPVPLMTGQIVPECMDMITVEQAIRTIDSYEP